MRLHALPRAAGQPTLGVGRPDTGAADKKRMQMQIDIPNPRSTLGSQAVLTLPRFSYIALQKVPYALERRSRSVDAGRGVLDQDRPRR